MPRALLQVADTGPLESLVHMLNSVGYLCYTPSKGLKDELRRIGCDTIVDIENLVHHWGYSEPLRLPILDNFKLLGAHDIYVDVKAHRNGPKVLKHYPHLKGRIAWYRINGSAPEHVVRTNLDGSVIEDMGDEVNLEFPTITPNQWYKKDLANWKEMAYTMWPPFIGESCFHYYVDEGWPPPRLNPDKAPEVYTNPICLIHNAKGWGYGDLFEPMRKTFGLKIHGVNSPDGLVRNHPAVPELLRTALCMIHLKSNDAPGYALYEALAAGCPVVCTRRLIWRCEMQDLFIPNETCLVFDRETHDGLTPKDVEDCMKEVAEHLDKLKDREFNLKIGAAGNKKLNEIMWSIGRDRESFNKFMSNHFGGGY